MHHQLPDMLFSGSNRPFLHTDDIVIVRYHERQEAEKIRISTSHNLITLLVRGRKDVLGLDGKVSVGVGEGFFLKKGNYLMNEQFGREEQYESLLFFFSDRIAHHLTADLNLTGLPAQETKSLVPFTVAPSINTFIQSILLLFDERATDELLRVLLPVKLKELFILLTETRQGRLGQGGSFFAFLQHLHHQPALELRHLMEQHFRENLTLEQYAFLTNQSLSSFKRLFKAAFGATPPARWIQERRLKEAALRLQTSRLTVSEVGFDVGFESAAHFVRAFRKHHGCTPGQFRQPDRPVL